MKLRFLKIILQPEGLRFVNLTPCIYTALSTQWALNKCCLVTVRELKHFLGDRP